MRRWTLLSRAERGGVILSGAWTTSTCYKPREIERTSLRSSVASSAALTVPPVATSPGSRWLRASSSSALVLSA